MCGGFAGGIKFFHGLVTLKALADTGLGEKAELIFEFRQLAYSGSGVKPGR
jgi:hypothetical protein